MADFTKNGVTITPGSGTGNTELKVKVANPPYQGFNDKTVEFTIQNTDYSVSKTLQASINGITVWGWGEDSGIEPVQVGSNPEDLTFSVTGKGNILKYKQINSSTEASLYIRKSPESSRSIIVKSLKFFIPSIDNENPIMALSNWDGSPTYLYTYENWPDAKWALQNGDIYEWRIDIELGPNTWYSNYDLVIEFGSPSSFPETPFIKVVQPPTEIISLNPDSVSLAADGTESSVQLSTVGAWTVE